MGSHLILTGEIISLCLPCHQLLPGQLWIGAENVLGRKVGEDTLVSNIGGGKCSIGGYLISREQRTGRCPIRHLGVAEHGIRQEDRQEDG